MTTVLIAFRRRVRAGREPDYERWLASLHEASQSAPGYVGVETLRPGNGPSAGEYVVIVRFESHEQLRAWEDTFIREDWLARLPPGVVDGEAAIQRLEGLEFWFEARDSQKMVAPSAHKMVLIIIPIVIAIVQAMMPILRSLLGNGHTFLRLVVSVTIQVSLMTYVIMPRVTRWLGRWLFSK